MLRAVRSCLAACGAALALLAAASPAAGQDLRILQHERVAGFAESAPAAAPGSAAKPRRAPAWSFVAFGRQFDVELEPNERLLRGLDREQRRRLGDVELYSGRLAGLPGSWVRVARHRGIVSGVIWDGATLYGVETASRLARHVVDTGQDEGGIAIFRWQDTRGVLRDTVIRPSGADPAPSDAERLTAMTAPLPTPVGIGAQLDLAIVADEEFVQREGDAAEAMLLAIANIVDGIYVMQTGIHFGIAELVLLDAPGPFTTTDAQALLSELSEYKFSTPEFRGSGLAHLFTGRDLDEVEGQTGQLVGIANLGVVCSARFGVALTQATVGTFSSALIAAHEIGHNFGAPHDGESGTPCEHEAEDFLMAPRVTGTREFSQCSLEQMAAEIADAACLTPLPPTNVAIEITQAPPEHVEGDAPFELAFAIRNVGPATAQAVEVTISFSDLAGPVFLETAGDSHGFEECVEEPPAGCRFPRLEPGAAAHYRVRLSALGAGSHTIDLVVSALNDVDAANDAASVTVNVGALTDLASEMGSSEVLVYTDEPVRLGGSVRNVGPIAASAAVAELSTSFLYDIVDIDAGAASCVLTEQGSIERHRCALGTLAPGASHALSWTMRPKVQHAGTLGNASVELRAIAAGPEHASTQSDNVAQTRIVRTDAKADLVATIQGASSFTVGNPVHLVAWISNQGPDDARDVAVVYAAANDLGATVDTIASSVGQCIVSAAATDFECEAARLAVGESVVITFEGTAAQRGTYRLGIAARTGSGDPNADDDTATHTFTVVEAAPPVRLPVSPTAGSGGSGATGILALLGLLAAACARGVRRARFAVALGAAIAVPFCPSVTAAQPAAGEASREPGIVLPEGPGRALVQSACMPCHDLAGIAAFKGYWNREQWAAMVATMIGHGAKLDAAETEAVVDYLTAHFGVEEDQRQRGMADESNDPSP